MKKLKETQQSQTQKGGLDMKKQETQQETQIYFVTFPSKVDNSKAREILAELRKRFPGQMPIFTRKPPYGKKVILNDIAGVLVIITFPYDLKKQEQAPKQAPMQQSTEGFKLSELIKNKT